MWWVPEWVEALWQVISKVFKIVWVLLTNPMGLLLATVSLWMTIYGYMKPVLSAIALNAGVIWDSMANAGGDAYTLMAAGWPSWLANGYAFVNAYLPVGESLVYFGIMVTTIVVCAVIRVVKSFVPTVAS
jgi:hypothetical protein